MSLKKLTNDTSSILLVINPDFIIEDFSFMNNNQNGCKDQKESG